MLLVKIAKYAGFVVHRRYYLIWPSVIKIACRVVPTVRSAAALQMSPKLDNYSLLYPPPQNVIPGYLQALQHVLSILSATPKRYTYR